MIVFLGNVFSYVLFFFLIERSQTDLFLHRPQAYRHMLFNRMEYRDYGIDVQCISFIFIKLRKKFFKCDIIYVRYQSAGGVSFF